MAPSTPRSRPSSLRFSVEQLESRVYLSASPAVDALLGDMTTDLRALLASSAEVGSEQLSCNEDDVLASVLEGIAAEDRQMDREDVCPPIVDKGDKGHETEIHVEEDPSWHHDHPHDHAALHASEQHDPMEIFEESDHGYALGHRRHMYHDDAVHALHGYSPHDAAHSFASHSSKEQHRTILHDVVVDDLLAEGPILSSVLADRYLEEKRGEQVKPWSPLRERQRAWRDFLPMQEDEAGKENKKDEKKEESQQPSVEEGAPVLEKNENPPAEGMPKGEQPEGVPSKNTAPSGKSEESSSSILNRSIGGAGSLVRGAWSGLKRFVWG